MKRTIIGVMGPGASATKKDLENAFELGALIARNEWVLLSGGRREGVMDAVNRGAKSENGLTIGILPSANDADTSDYVDVSILTDLGSARNNINVLSSDVVVACGMGPGTASEVALALKAKKNVVLLAENQKAAEFFTSLDAKRVQCANNPQDAINKCKGVIQALTVRH